MKEFFRALARDVGDRDGHGCLLPHLRGIVEIARVRLVHSAMTIVFAL